MARYDEEQTLEFRHFRMGVGVGVGGKNVRKGAQMLREDGISNIYNLIAALVEPFSAYVSLRVSIGKAAGVILNDIAGAVKTQGGKYDVIDLRLLFKIG